jgi:hypothetical protein
LQGTDASHGKSLLIEAGRRRDRQAFDRSWITQTLLYPKLRQIGCPPIYKAARQARQRRKGPLINRNVS